MKSNGSYDMVHSRPPAALSDDSDSDSLPTLATHWSRPVRQINGKNTALSSMAASAPVGLVMEETANTGRERRFPFNIVSSSVLEEDKILSRQTTAPPMTEIVQSPSSPSHRLDSTPITPPPARTRQVPTSSLPDSVKRHQILADLLFPPSPPLLHISPSTIIPALTPRALTLVEKLWTNSREDDDEEELKEIISDSEIEREREASNCMSGLQQNREMEEVEDSLGLLRIQQSFEMITPSKSRPLTSSSGKSSTAPPSVEKQVPFPTTLKKKIPAINWIVLSDSSDDEGKIILPPKERNATPKATPVRRKVKEAIESGSDIQSQSEFDPYAGLLT